MCLTKFEVSATSRGNATPNLKMTIDQVSSVGTSGVWDGRCIKTAMM